MLSAAKQPFPGPIPRNTRPLVQTRQSLVPPPRWQPDRPALRSRRWAGCGQRWCDDAGTLPRGVRARRRFLRAPGAVTAEALRRGLAGGFRPALLLELGSLVGDASWAAIALAGAAVLVQHRPMQFLLGAAGVYFLLRLAWGALRAAWRGRQPATRPGLRGGATSRRGHSSRSRTPGLSPSGAGWGASSPGSASPTRARSTTSSSSAASCSRRRRGAS